MAEGAEEVAAVASPTDHFAGAGKMIGCLEVFGRTPENLLFFPAPGISPRIGERKKRGSRIRFAGPVQGPQVIRDPAILPESCRRSRTAAAVTSSAGYHGRMPAPTLAASFLRARRLVAIAAFACFVLVATDREAMAHPWRVLTIGAVGVACAFAAYWLDPEPNARPKGHDPVPF